MYLESDRIAHIPRKICTYYATMMYFIDCKKISWHENFSVSRSKSNIREISFFCEPRNLRRLYQRFGVFKLKGKRKGKVSTNGEINMSQNWQFCPYCELKCCDRLEGQNRLFSKKLFSVK